MINKDEYLRIGVNRKGEIVIRDKSWFDELRNLGLSTKVLRGELELSLDHYSQRGEKTMASILEAELRKMCAFGEENYGSYPTIDSVVNSGHLRYAA